MKTIETIFILLFITILSSCSPKALDGDYTLQQGSCSKTIRLGSLGAEKYLIKFKTSDSLNTEILVDKKGETLEGKLGDKKLIITIQHNNLVLHYNNRICSFKK